MLTGKKVQLSYVERTSEHSAFEKYVENVTSPESLYQNMP